MPRASWLAVYLCVALNAFADLPEQFARKSSRDVKIPRALVHQLESEYKDYLANLEFPKKDVKRQLLNLSIDLTQDHEAALHENTRVLTPLGGGVIDLSDYLTPLRGAFHLQLDVKKEDGRTPPGLRVFFISRTKAKKIDGEEFGAGCGKYMEITSYLKSKAARKGLVLYTAEQRYLPVVGGTFVAASFDSEALSVGSLTLLDSRYPDVMCE